MSVPPGSRATSGGPSRAVAPRVTAVLKPSEVLSKAADLIAPEGAWTTNVTARGVSGREVDERGRYAVCWCAVGAIYGATPRMYRTLRAREFLRAAIGTEMIGQWNDAPNRTQAEVVSALRKAAEQASEAGQ